LEVVIHLLPIAIGVALSSVPIMVMIFILLSPNRSRSAIPFLIGWVVGILITVTLCALLAQAVPTPRFGRRTDTAIGIAQIAVGALLMVLGIISVLRARGRAAKPLPAWLQSASRLGPWAALGMGLVLNIRPKGLLLAVAAGLVIRADSGSPEAAIAAVLFYTVISASTVATPIIITIAAPTRMEPRLQRTADWMQRHGALLASGIVILIGAVIVGMGIARL
jgi:MFS family permease